MTAIAKILKACLSLFFDDELLAFAILVVVALATLLVFAIGETPLAGAVLVCGTVTALVGSVWRTASTARR